MADKKMYIIRLSEDGNYGVASNMKRAWEMCEETGYIMETISFVKDSELKYVKANYQNFCKHMKNGICTVDCEDNNEIEIQLFNLNA